MSGASAQAGGPDFAMGVAVAEIPDGGMKLGQVAGEAVLLARLGDELFAVAATCSHYGGPLADGLLVGDEVRCPYHHACFSLRTGEPLAPPALNPIACYDLERRGDRVVVLGKRTPKTAAPAIDAPPASIVIVGAGAAGNLAAETLRKEGYAGPITMIGAEPSLPVDRPNLSKDYLAGTAPEDWIPLRGREYYDQQKIALRLGATVTAIDAAQRELTLADGERLSYGALLLCTGAEPVRLTIPGAERVHYLRSFDDSRAIIAQLDGKKRAVVIGGSFIGLEVAASLRARNLEVDVVAPDARPLERVLGPELGEFVRSLHESHGVRFHLGQRPTACTASHVETSGGESLPADLIVAGIGVRPRIALAEAAGLTLAEGGRGVLVDEYLETSARGIFAAGDLASWPDARSGQRLRVEHWAVAERQGQTAARNLLGRRVPFRAVPFFWSQHYDVPINYVGHAERWDAIEILGSLADKHALVVYRHAGKVLAVASIYRDVESLEVEALLERDDQVGLDARLKAWAHS